MKYGVFFFLVLFMSATLSLEKKENNGNMIFDFCPFSNAKKVNKSSNIERYLDQSDRNIRHYWP
jgi:hypothetical protein